MPKLTDDEILNYLDQHGERHYYYNEEHYPNRLEELSKKEIIESCYILSIKIGNLAHTAYNKWVKEQNNEIEDDRRLRTLIEIYTTQFCDTSILKLEDDLWFKEHHPEINIEWGLTYSL